MTIIRNLKVLLVAVGASCMLPTVLQAQAILSVLPSSASTVGIPTNGQTYLTYTVTNNTARPVSAITIDPSYSTSSPSKLLNRQIVSNTCQSSNGLAAGASCSFVVSMQGLSANTTTLLMPRVCTNAGATCSVPTASNRVQLVVSSQIPAVTFPTPYAGSFYPIYNSGVGQWIEPNDTMPFDQVSTLYASFAHTYPQGQGAVMTYEVNQPDEPQRLAMLTQVARQVNPNIKILITLGWGKNDWTYINQDYVNRANLFVPSVVEFIRANGLDGLDIDDEEIGTTTGSIPQANYDGVIFNLRNALNYASLQDGKTYYLTTSPAGNNSEPGGLEDTQVSANNASSFNLINIQTYFNGDPYFGEDFLDALVAIGYPSEQIANGIDTEMCAPVFPSFDGLAGLFNWNFSADSGCGFVYTEQLADLVGYP